MYALVDCNNFYASCEKLFRPDLKNQPIVVLSNNDGCIVARSKEAKALGIQMGVPYFQAKHLIQKHGVTVFSSNYELYADISHRVMATLAALAPSVEIYSIDEAFIDLSGHPDENLNQFGITIQTTIYQHTGIQVGIGIASTKTLAKLANHAAKQYPKTGGVVVLDEPHRLEKLMKLTPIHAIWGIGRQLTQQLTHCNIHTAWDFVQYDTSTLRRKFSVTLERVQRELQGIRCFTLNETPRTKQQIICSRSFGQRITTLAYMTQAICTYTATACNQLRAENMTAKRITIFCRTSHHSEATRYYSNSQTLELSYPTDNSQQLLATASHLMASIYKEGFFYAKAGIILSELYAPGTFQLSLFDEPDKKDSKQKSLQAVVDQFNLKHQNKLFYASEGTEKPWSMKRDKVSPRYTTRWKELPLVS